MTGTRTISLVKIETVLLDAGGVLVFPNWQRVSATLRRHGVQVAADALFAADPHARFAVDTAGHVAATSDADRGSRFFHLVLQRAGVPAGPPLARALDELWAYHTEHNLWEHVPADVVPALERLASLDVTVAIASNANGVVHRAFERAGLTRFFDVICDSCIEGVEKPDPRFFRIVLDRAGGRAESAIHVGDLYHVDVLGARKSGIHPLLLDPLDLYAGYDVERVKNLEALVDYISARRSTPHSGS